MKNLAPELVRQRLIIEGITSSIVKPDEIKDYLNKLAEVIDMEVLSGPFAYSAHEKGFGGWIHWKSSGAHFYSYPTKNPLFSVDIYSCKSFAVSKVIEFSKEYFSVKELVWKEVNV